MIIGVGIRFSISIKNGKCLVVNSWYNATTSPSVLDTVHMLIQDESLGGGGGGGRALIPPSYEEDAFEYTCGIFINLCQTYVQDYGVCVFKKKRQCLSDPQANAE